MDVSVILYFNQTEKELVSFFQSILAQTAPIKELIILNHQNDRNTNTVIQEIIAKAPFNVIEIPLTTVNSLNLYLRGMHIATGEIILFARAEHLFKTIKVAEFKRYFEQDPYYKYMFSNAEIINEDNEIVIQDYFGLSGFYERWDRFKDLNTVLGKQVGFVSETQVAITDKFAQEVLQFFQDYPTYESNLHFNELLIMMIGLNHPETIKEIPYLVNQLKRSDKEIELIKKKKRFQFFSGKVHADWLQNFIDITTLINKKHSILPFLQKSLLFHKSREENLLNSSKNRKIIYSLGNFVAFHYKKFTSHSTNYFYNDSFNSQE